MCTHTHTHHIVAARWTLKAKKRVTDAEKAILGDREAQWVQCDNELCERWRLLWRKFTADTFKCPLAKVQVE